MFNLINPLERKDASGAETLDLSVEIKLAPAGDGIAEGTIEGYGSVFGLLDRGGDIVKAGAFKASLAAWRKKKQMPKMLWYHDPSQPIGVWTDIVEDEKGLKVKGELILDIPQAQTAHALLKRDAISGLSIGYRTQDYEIDRTTGARFLKKVELWEISLVTFPMLEEAQIDAVKNRNMLKNFNPREMEGALRDAGLSRSDAVKATAIFRETLQRDAGDSEAPLRDGVRDVLMNLRKATAAFRS